MVHFLKIRAAGGRLACRASDVNFIAVVPLLVELFGKDRK